jgi:hypothetical protein
MNLSLIDPFVLAQDYPDTLTEKLSMCCIQHARIQSADRDQEVAMQHVYASITPATI